MKKSKPETNGKDGGRAGADLGGGIFGSLSGFIESVGRLAGTAEGQARRQGEGAGDKGAAAAGGKGAADERVGGILNGLAELAEKLNEISAKGETIERRGEFAVPGKEGDLKGVYGFTLKMGLGDQGGRLKVEPFGNIRKDKSTGEAVVQEINEPAVDVFADAAGTTVIAEMPGVGPDDIQADVQDDVLTISAQKGQKKYRKEMLLGHVVPKGGVTVTCNNGIVTIRCGKAG